MAYFQIDGHDYSHFVNSLEIDNKANYTAQVNAAGDSVVDYVNKKRIIKVGIIPLTSEQIKPLLVDLEKFNVSISYREPRTGALVTGVDCIIPTFNPEYYTIQTGKVMFKEFSLSFTEL